MNVIFPILENLQLQKKEVFNIPLYQSEKIDTNIPIIAFAVASESERNRLIENTEDVALSGGELVRIAFKNLKEFNLSWQQKTINHTQDILSAEAEWASEKILDQHFLIEACQLLSSTQILVAIPKRGMILAAAYTHSEADIAFCTYSAKQFEGISGTPLFDKLFIVENGQIIGLSTIKPTISKPLDEDIIGMVEVKVKKEISSKIVKMVYINGFESYTVTLGAQDFEDFSNASYQIILDILNQNRHNPSFNGLIEFHILSEWLPKNSDFDTTLNHFLDKLKIQPTLAKYANIMRKDVELTFTHLSDLQTGNSHLKHRLKIHSTI